MAEQQNVETPIPDATDKSARWSRANTLATLEMLGFAIVGSVLAKSTTLDGEAIQQLLTDATQLFGSTAIPMTAIKALVEYMRSDQ